MFSRLLVGCGSAAASQLLCAAKLPVRQVNNETEQTPISIK